MLFYRAALPLSRQTLTFVSDQIRVHRKQLGSVWRKLNPGQQALLVLVYLRKGEPFAEIGAGFDASTTTCWRYVNETVQLLAARAPKLRKAKREGMAYVIIDGTLIPIDRVAADRPFYSGCDDRCVLPRGRGLTRTLAGLAALCLICRPWSGVVLAAAGPVGRVPIGALPSKAPSQS
jgi:hypothetical protein